MSVAPAVRVEPGIAARLAGISRRALPFEACGMLGGQFERGGLEFRVAALITAENRAGSDATHHFLIDPVEVAAAERQFTRAGRDLIGFFHSHASGRAVPSPDDLARASGWPGYLHSIIGLTGAASHEIRWYRTDKNQWLELKGRAVA